MKTLLILLTLSSSAFAQADFLTVSQAKEVDSYMDNICPDTYCGGDIAFYTHGLTCHGNSCTLKLSGSGLSEFDNDAITAASNTSAVTSEYANVVINYGSMSVGAMDSDGYEGVSLSFSCTMNNLPMEMTDFSDKTDLIYDLVVWGCIRELEKTVYSWE